MKSHRSRLIAAGVAVMLSATLAGCGQVDPSAAARVGDRVVSEQDVATAVNEIGSLKLGQQIDSSQVATFLVIGPILLERLRQVGEPVSENDALKQLQDPHAKLSQPTLEVLRTMAAIQLINQAQQIASQPTQDKARTETARNMLHANAVFQEDLQKQVSDGTIVPNPKYIKQPVNWVPQEEQQAPQQ